MSDENAKTYTLEEVRKAFQDGGEHARMGYSRSAIATIAKSHYPAPKKLREVKEGRIMFFTHKGEIWGRFDGERDLPLVVDGCLTNTRLNWAATPERIKLWADLLANPYEDDNS